MYFFVSINFYIILQIGSTMSELMGPYQCPTDSRCQDIHSCSAAYKKKTETGQYFYCGPQNRIDYMVCCMEKGVNWNSGDDMENELLTMLMPNNSHDSDSPASTKLETSQDRAKSTGPTSIVTNILSNEDVQRGNELQFSDIFNGLEGVDSNGNSLFQSNNADSNSNKEPAPPTTTNSVVNPPDLKRDSRKSFSECSCERGPQGPQGEKGPPGENGKVIYVPVLISSSTPTLNLPADIAASVIPYLQQVQPPQSNFPLNDAQLVPMYVSQQTFNQDFSKPSQNAQRSATQISPYYNQKIQPYATTNSNPSVPSVATFSAMQNKVKTRRSHS